MPPQAPLLSPEGGIYRTYTGKITNGGAGLRGLTHIDGLEVPGTGGVPEHRSEAYSPPWSFFLLQRIF